MKSFRNVGNGIKIISVAVFLILLLTLVFYFLFKDSSTLISEMIVNKIQYDASKEIDDALTRLSNDRQKADIIVGTETNNGVIALTFDGLSDRETMDKIIVLLNENKMNGTFFVSGIEAAEDGEAVKNIVTNNQMVGNYTLSGSKDIMNLSQQEQIEDLCRANLVLKSILGITPTLLKCNTTHYGDSILESAYASNLNKVVLSNQYLSYQSFSSYEMTTNYIRNIKTGTIVSIKLDDVLDESEYRKSNQPIQPAIDKKTLDKKSTEESVTEEEQLIQMITWLLKALKENGVRTVFVDDDALTTAAIITSQESKGSSPGSQTAAFLGLPIVSSSQTKLPEKNNDSKTDQIDYPDFKPMIEKNEQKKAPVVSHLYTSEKGVVFTFRGISNEVVLDNVLGELEDMGNAKATFFVTAEEIEAYPSRIVRIIEKGHELGNGGVTQDSHLQNLSVEEVCKEIYRCDLLLTSIGVNSNNYMPGYGYTEGNIREAVSVISNGEKEYNLITYTVSMVRNSFSTMPADEIIETCLPVYVYKSLKRGDIAYFRMDSTVFNDNAEMVGELVSLVAENYVFNGYVSVCVDSTEEDSKFETRQIPINFEILPLSHMINTYENFETGTRGLYSIQSPSEAVEIDKIDSETADQMIYSNYIGNPSVSGSQLKGFIDTTGIDTTGKIDENSENVIYLTFDDWGGDPVIMSILDVLEKHQVEASFFVIAKNIDIDQEDLPKEEQVSPNPNLLREMALKGHDICSHNYFHMLIDIDDDLKQKETLQHELVRSYKTLSMIVGDIAEPKLFFRPPTLAVSQTGLQTVFESGYKKSISGDFSVHDYDCTSAEEVFNTLEYGNGTYEIGAGSIVILHMNDQSGFTAEGLDIFLTENANKPEEERYEFAKLSDYLNEE
ncbi:MAG: peptidoglycan-N-acetylglucosamine deacetylase [Acetobacterium sp.]|nr:peptidoglycan-N-acetylglucosamine deacetylase [Acetobacterium sp.]